MPHRSKGERVGRHIMGSSAAAGWVRRGRLLVGVNAGRRRRVTTAVVPAPVTPLELCCGACGARLDPTRVAVALAVALTGAPGAPERPALLSHRQWEVITLLAQGLRPAAIAARLGVSVHTVRHHLRHAFARCQVRSQAELVE